MLAENPETSSHPIVSQSPIKITDNDAEPMTSTRPEATEVRKRLRDSQIKVRCAILYAHAKRCYSYCALTIEWNYPKKSFAPYLLNYRATRRNLLLHT